MKSLQSIIVLSCLLPMVAYADPQKVEMIFLSPKKISMMIELLDKYNVLKQSAQLAQNDMDKCVPMGEGCFHPQYGYIEKKVEAKPDPKIIEEQKLELKTFNAIETGMINCDKNSYFDIFCGKEKPNTPPAKIEIWFDVSSSLKMLTTIKIQSFVLEDPLWKKL